MTFRGIFSRVSRTPDETFQLGDGRGFAGALGVPVKRQRLLVRR
jgi:hypothetical protein